MRGGNVLRRLRIASMWAASLAAAVYALAAPYHSAH